METVRTILVIEDQEFTDRVIRAALRGKPFDIHTAADGAAGYQMLVELQPDLLLLDLSLPGMDGWEILAAMRTDPALADTPVIIVSAQGRRAVESRAADFDVAALVNKPFRVPELRQAVDMVLGAAELA